MALHTLPATEPPSRLSFLFVATLISKVLMEGVYYPPPSLKTPNEYMYNAPKTIFANAINVTAKYA